MADELVTAIRPVRRTPFILLASSVGGFGTLLVIAGTKTYGGHVAIFLGSLAILVAWRVIRDPEWCSNFRGEFSVRNGLVCVGPWVIGSCKSLRWAVIPIGESEARALIMLDRSPFRAPIYLDTRDPEPIERALSSTAARARLPLPSSVARWIPTTSSGIFAILIIVLGAQEVGVKFAVLLFPPLALAFSLARAVLMAPRWVWLDADALCVRSWGRTQRVDVGAAPYERVLEGIRFHRKEGSMTLLRVQGSSAFAAPPEVTAQSLLDAVYRLLSRRNLPDT